MGLCYNCNRVSGLLFINVASKSNLSFYQLIKKKFVLKLLLKFDYLRLINNHEYLHLYIF